MNITRTAMKPMVRHAARGVARQVAIQLPRATASYTTSTMHLSKMDDLKVRIHSYE